MAKVGSEFEKFQKTFENESALRENIRAVVRDLEASARTISTTLSQVHLRGANVPELCLQARGLFAPVQASFAQLKQLVPPERFYRYNDSWRNTLQQLCFCIAFLVFLESARCVTLNEVEQLLGVKAEDTNEFHFDIEDFLMGLCSLSNELSRLAVNSVIAENYLRPLEIQVFMAELNEGFQMLNLKNDNLRKRFDSIKYDIKRIEEIVYDVTIRGLAKKADLPTLSGGSSGV